MSVPRDFVQQVQVPKGGEAGFALKTMRRGTIHKLRVVQLDEASGDKTGFSYCLYNSSAGCPEGPNPTQASIDAGFYEKLYRITPVFSVASGQDQLVSGDEFPEEGVTDLGLMYECQDDTEGNPGKVSPSNGGAWVYLKITCPNSGILATKTFGVALTIEDPVAP